MQISNGRLLSVDGSKLIEMAAEGLAAESRMRDISSSLKAQDTELSALDAECQSFALKTDKLLELRNANARVTAKTEVLCSLLGIPDLLGELVALGCYEDAIDLLATVTRMRSRYPSINTIELIVHATEPHIAKMSAQLTRLLLSDNKLPLFIRTIGFLRKLAVESEPQLQLTFIRHRLLFLQTRLQINSSLLPFDFLKQYIESCREHVFDILTQFKSIFQTNHQSTSSSSLLTSFSCTLVDSMTETFITRLSQIQSFAHIGTLHTQAMYLGLSLSRVGVDLRLVLSSCFSSHVGALFRERVETHTATLVEKLKPGMEIEIQEQFSSDSFNHSESTNTIQPNPQLNRYTVFSIYYNALMQLFNECRLVVFINERQGMRDALVTNLDRVDGTLTQLLDHTQRASKDIVTLADWYATFKSGVLRHFDTGFNE